MQRCLVFAGLIAAATLAGAGPAQTEQYDVLELKTPEGFIAAYASTINAAGKVVGHAERAGGMDRAVMWDEAGHPTLIPGAAGFSTVALDFTPQGAAVGWRYPGTQATQPQGFYAAVPTPLALSATSASGKAVGFVVPAWSPVIFTQGGAPQMLSKANMPDLQVASGINASGLICGSGTKIGQLTAFVLKPRHLPVTAVTSTQLKSVLGASRPKVSVNAETKGTSLAAATVSPAAGPAPTAAPTPKPVLK